MPEISSRFRLRSSAFERPDETEKIHPKRIIFLSVEGDETERTYFQNLNTHLDAAVIHIEVLRHRRGDGYSDPAYVIELLDEYINVRKGELIPSELPESLIHRYSKEYLKKYLDDNESLSPEQRKEISDALMAAGIDLEYRRYLQKFDNETDYFAVILDRDCGSHSRELMQTCIELCADKNYGCFITNPCFEFWLLLHLCNVRSDFTPEDLDKLYTNPTVSKRHTLVSLEVSKRAHHTKSISQKKFDEIYFPNITYAIENASAFTSTLPDLLDHLGSNLPELLKILGFHIP